MTETPIGGPVDGRRYQPVRYEIVVRAETPIAHHAENVGNHGLLFRRKVRTENGFVNVPNITANALRHKLREAAVYVLLDAANLLTSEALSHAALRLLFNGGMVTGRGDGGTVSLNYYDELCDLIPSMAIFGGCANNRIIPGRLVVSDAILICEETCSGSDPFVPSWASKYAEEHGGIDGSRAHVCEEQSVRMDSSLDPEKRALLTAGERDTIMRRLAGGEQAHADDDAIAREASKSTMMPYSYETLAQGSMLFWTVQATCLSALDYDAFNLAVAGFLSNAYVGGKRGTGHGKLRGVEGRNVNLVRPAESLGALQLLDAKTVVGAIFREHVAPKREAIARFLRTVNS